MTYVEGIVLNKFPPHPFDYCDLKKLRLTGCDLFQSTVEDTDGDEVQLACGPCHGCNADAGQQSGVAVKRQNHDAALVLAQPL